MSTTSGSSQDGIPGGTAETATNEPPSVTPGMSGDSSPIRLEKEIPTSPSAEPTATAEVGPSAGSSSPSSHHGSNVEASSATAFKDKNEPFTKGQSKRKHKKSQGSSRYRLTSDVDSQQSPSQEDSITNENEEELDFEEEEYESLEEGEEESDKEEDSTNFNNSEWAAGDSKESNVRETKEKSKKKDDDDEDEDGEVNSDDDLEEGEVKEDDSDSGGSDDEANGQKKLTKKIVKTLNTNNQQQQQQAKTSICRFFAKGQCTWGLNCRFLHVAAPPVLTLPLKLPNQRGFPYQVGLNPTGLHPTGMHPTGAHPTGVHPAGPQGVTTVAHPLGTHPTGHHSIPRPPLNRHQAAALAGTTIHPPHPPSSSQSSSSNTDSAWVRGLRNAKEMLVKANKRKEEESDFEKRFNANPEDEGTSHSKHSHHSRESPESGDYGDRRSPHNYHARDREKRTHREAPRRDYNREGRDGRDTREREPRDRERDNAEREPRDDYWNNSEYERRRRLAFESAPWNEEQSPPMAASSRGNVRPREAAEMYRDPWRRSKSPQAKWSGGRRADVSTASKRSHSMSSISDSESGSGPSGSESISGSEGSFSGSEVSYSDASQVSGRSPRDERHKTKSSKSSSRTARDANKPRPKQMVDQAPHHSRDRGGGAQPPPKSGPVRDKMGSVPMNKSRSARISVDEEPSGSGPRKKSGPVSPPPPPPVSKPRRDSWSDSDSGSMSQSDSSLYSGSESGESDAFSGASDTHLEEDKRSKGYRNRRDMKPHPSSNRQTYDSSSRRAPPQRSRTSDSPPPPSSSSSHHANPKRMKMSAGPSSSRDNNSMKHRHSSALSNEDLPASTQAMSSKKHPPSSPSDGPKKNPIKMTFKKKHSNLKTDRVITAKLGGRRSEDEVGDEEEEEESDRPNCGVGLQRTSHADGEEDGALNEDEHVKKRTSYEHHSSFSDDGEDEGNSRSKHRQDNEGQSSSLSPSSKVSRDGSTRREHLLKQLEAVEAMIAKKKAKLQ